jgi:DNA-binding HxlR family transcriptional regulator
VAGGPFQSKAGQTKKGRFGKKPKHPFPIILYHLSTGNKRYSELKKEIPAITEKMLIQHLKQLEADGLVIKKAKAVVPPFVTYRLSDSGIGLVPVISAMANWAIKEKEGIL